MEIQGDMGLTSEASSSMRRMCSRRGSTPGSLPWAPGQGRSQGQGQGYGQGQV